MYYIDIQGKKATPLTRKTFSELHLSERYDLQEWIAGCPDILGEKLLIIQKEFSGFSETNERLDLLALDKYGRLVVIENKLDDSGRDVVWQALKYVSYCATMMKSEICEIYQQYLGTSGDAAERIAEFYDQEYESVQLNATEGDQRIILVAANFRKEVTSTVLWLRNYHGVDITCIKVTPYLDGDKLLLDVEQIIPTQDIGDYQIRLTAKAQEESASSKADTMRGEKRIRFWGKALPTLRAKTGIFTNYSPTRDNYLDGPSGHSGIFFQPRVLMNGARAQLTIATSDAEWNKQVFDQLKARENELDESLRTVLEWHENPDLISSYVCVQYSDYGLNDEEHWDEIISFLADSTAALMRAFKPMLEDISNR